MFTKKNRLLIFLFFYVTLFLVYYRSQNGIMYVNDMMLNLYEFKYTGWKGVFQSYNMIFLWYVPSLFYFICYKLFGINWLGWHAVLCLLHTINAYLIMILLRRIDTQLSSVLLFIIGFIFLISPFQTEVVAWGALFHYSLSLIFLLSALFAQLNYYNTYRFNYVIAFHLFYIFSLFCFEQSFLFPFVFLSCSIFIVPLLYPVSWKQSLIKTIKVFFTGNIMSIAVYFVLTKIHFGVWIAHYGAASHANIKLRNMYDNLLNYHMKFLFYYRYIPESIRKYYNYVSVHKFLFVLFPLIIMSTAYIFYKTKFYLKDRTKIILFLYSAFILMLIPVLNLDSSFTFEIQSDRYGYSASLFFYAFIFYFLYSFFNRKVVYGLGILIILINGYLLINAVELWHKSGNVSFSLIKNYPLQPNQKAYILNMPDNYAGVYTLRNGFYEGLSIIHQKNYKIDSRPVAWTNIFSNENETYTEIINDSTYYVKCLKNGKWYYYNGAGATDYENKNYKVDFDEWNFAYTLTLKQKPKDTTYILQCYGDKWKMIDTLIPD